MFQTLLDRGRVLARAHSVQLAAIGAALSTLFAIDPTVLQAAWQSMPAELRALIPANVSLWITGVLFGLVVLARAVPQPAVTQRLGVLAVAAAPAPVAPLAWMTVAAAKLCIREVAGSKHNPTILAWLKLLGAWWANDEEPWCGTYVAICLKEAGVAIIKHWYRAKAWAEWGVAVTPRFGALLVFGRGGGGHVGFYLGEAMRMVRGKRVLCYRVRGGNQSNMVCDTWIEASRLIASRWPTGVEVTGGIVLLDAGAEPISRNEA